jgi:hypothetical protein
MPKKGNGNGNGEKRPTIRFSGLESRVRRLLLTRAPDPTGEENKVVENFRREFLQSFPELAEDVLDAKVMRRLMLSATAERRNRQTAMKRRKSHLLVTSF